ncbi:MAG TPA: response regulator transcription factor [Mariprofundaceae bacterium]|nr:response regulator transcription factor [Mariprofundaceae bacterium]
MAPKIKVQLVDDHAVVRAGFRRLLEDMADISVVAESATSEECLLDYRKHHPDVVVLDVFMPGMGGMEAIRRLLAIDEDAKVVVLSFYDSWIIPMRALKAGARGYLSKRTAPGELIAAVRKVAAGQSYIEPAIAQKIAEQSVFGGQEPIERLTSREFEVFQLLVQGERVADIAKKLHVSPKTVGIHRAHIMQKLETSSLASLTRMAGYYGLLEQL